MDERQTSERTLAEIAITQPVTSKQSVESRISLCLAIAVTDARHDNRLFAELNHSACCVRWQCFVPRDRWSCRRVRYGVPSNRDAVVRMTALKRCLQRHEEGEDW
jgi:hypothetical protein